LSPEDESLLFNLVRALVESDKIEEARTHISKILSKKTQHKETKDLLTYMNRKKKK
jgi:hypothetical protein